MKIIILFRHQKVLNRSHFRRFEGSAIDIRNFGFKIVKDCRNLGLLAVFIGPLFILFLNQGVYLFLKIAMITL